MFADNLKINSWWIVWTVTCGLALISDLFTVGSLQQETCLCPLPQHSWRSWRPSNIPRKICCGVFSGPSLAECYRRSGTIDIKQAIYYWFCLLTLMKMEKLLLGVVLDKTISISCICCLENTFSDCIVSVLSGVTGQVYSCSQSRRACHSTALSVRRSLIGWSTMWRAWPHRGWLWISCR